MARSPWRAAAAAALAAALLIASAWGGDDDEDEAATEPEARDRCSCELARACWHFLKAPVDPPNDPCWCGKCEHVGRHDGTRCPDGWNEQCFRTGKIDCFLRRLTASWRLTCSECLAETKCCNVAHQERCPACGEGERKDPFLKDPFGKDARKEAAARVAVEQKLFDRRKPVVVWSQRFYVVTDIAGMRIKTQSGGTRLVDAHEYAHIMLERAEKAYREFTQAFRGRVTLQRPMGIFLPHRDTTAYALREAYFRNRNAPMIYSSYSSANESHISDGYCFNGLCVSASQAGGDDTTLHQAVRHLMGNILVTCWVRCQGDNNTMPRWVFEGVGHWLGKRHADLGDEVWYCIGEERKVSGSGKGWRKAISDQAVLGKFGPIEELLAKNSLGQLTYQDHQRAWGFFEICMAEWRDPWVDMLADLRKEVNVREAFQKRLDCTPEEFQRRWIDRLTGARKTMAPVPRDTAGGPDAATGPALNGTGDPKDLAVKVRELGTVSDPAIVRALLDLVANCESDLVRETVMTTLRKTKDEAARRAIWEHGLAHGGRFARAYSARLCRKLKLADARDALRKLLDDPFWLARSEAALAAATIRDFDAQARLRAMVEDSAPKARIAAMDALATYGEEVNRLCVPVIVKNLEHPAWQVRLATCQALAQVGDQEAVGPLIDRMQVEGGRVGEAIHEALKAITQDDLGRKPEHWRKWWEAERERVKERGGFVPAPKRDSRYAEVPQPTYYGVELFSQRVAFVLDTSRSTNRKFNPDVNTRKRLLGTYPPGSTIFDICQGEVAKSVEALDPRAHFNVIAFGSEVRRWEKSLVPATESNKRSAGSFARSCSAAGETNFYGALKAALDMDEGAAAGPDFCNTPDTITFLTDGTPTVGEITDPETLLEWYTEMNRYARVRTHTIAFGQLEVDEKLLKGMAWRNGGDFVQLSEES